MTIYRLALAVVAASAMSVLFSSGMSAQQVAAGAKATEVRVKVGNASLYTRVSGSGTPAVVLHGGPDFDHTYLLPELDAFGDLLRLIYYDQRGRGKSADGVRADDVTLASDLSDLDAVRAQFELSKVLLLGHSWGTVLALEYALRHPDRVSGLILMNPAPASANDLTSMRSWYLQKIGSEMEQQRQIAQSAAYRNAEPGAVTARYRIHFRPALYRAEDYEKLMSKMDASFKSQGSEGILKARAVEDRLMEDTWANASYDLLPRLRTLNIPTLVIAGEHDFIPVSVARNIAAALPNAKLVVIEECGHFGYMECALDVRKAIVEFLQ